MVKNLARLLRRLANRIDPPGRRVYSCGNTTTNSTQVRYRFDSDDPGDAAWFLDHGKV